MELRDITFDQRFTLKILEDYAFKDVEAKPRTVTVKPVLFIPKDLIPYTYQAGEKENVKKGLKFIQSWFLSKTGVTFNFSDPVFFEGKKNLVEYETNPTSYDQSRQAALLRAEISQEISVSQKEYYLVFLYGKESVYWGQFFDIAVVGQIAIDGLRQDQSYDTQRYAAMGMIAHELGHVFGGLVDLPAGTGSMMSFVDTFISFPNVDFTEGEKQALRKHMN